MVLVGVSNQIPLRVLVEDKIKIDMDRRALLSTVTKFLDPDSFTWPVPASNRPVMLSSSHMLAMSVLKRNRLEAESRSKHPFAYRVLLLVDAPVFVGLQV